MDEERSQQTCLNTTTLLTATLWFFVVAAICIWVATKDFLIFIAVLGLISIIERHWKKKFNAFIVPRWMVKSAKGTTLFKISFMALSEQWSLCLIIISVVVSIFTSVSFQLLLDQPRSIGEMNMSSGYIRTIKEGRPGRRSSNKDYLFIQVEKGEILKLHSIYTPEQLEKLSRAKKENKVVTFWYQDKGALFKDSIWEIRDNNEIIQKYDEPLVRNIYSKNKKALIVLIIYLLATYIFITVYFYIKLKQQKGVTTSEAKGDVV